MTGKDGAGNVRHVVFRVLAVVLGLAFVGVSVPFLWAGAKEGFVSAGLGCGIVLAIYGLTGWAPSAYLQEVFRKRKSGSDEPGSKEAVQDRNL